MSKKGNVQLKCSDCNHYRKIEISGDVMVFKCTNLEAFKRNQGATKVGYINAHTARFFANNCGKDAVYFVEKTPEPKETLKRSFFTGVLLSDNRAKIEELFIKRIFVLVVLVVLFVLMLLFPITDIF
jgi:hypothetical protein